MPKYSIVIRYDDLEAYQKHGPQIEQLTKDGFAEKGATNQSIFISTRSLPPIHTTSFIVPENVTVEDLKQVAFPGGVIVDIHQEP